MVNAFAKKIRFFVAFAFVTVSSGLMSAQAQDFTIETTAPESVAVCGDAVSFTIRITKNISSAVQNLKLYPAMPSGMQYVAGSATGIQSVSNADGLYFTLNDFTGTATVVFSAKATCGLVETLETQGSNLINNDTRLTYLLGTQMTLLEPNGSESYSVLYPELELFVPESEKNMGAPFIDHPMSRHISIKNSGLGSLKTLSFYLKADPELNVKKLQLVTSNGYAVLTSPAGNQLGRLYVIDNFSGAGDGDQYLEEGETVNLIDSVVATTSKGSIETIYTAQWGCDEVCNPNDKQASFAAYVEAIGGKAAITYNAVNTDRSDFCNDAPMHIVHTFRNDGSGNQPATRDAAFDFQWTLMLSGFDTQIDYHLSIIGANGTNPKSVDPLLSYSESSSQTTDGFMLHIKTYKFDFANVFTTDPDGEGIGLADVDGDHFYDDLPVGATLTMQSLMKITFQGDVHSYQNETFLGSSETYKVNLWSGESYGSGWGRTLYNISVIHNDLLGVADLQSTKRETFTLNIELQESDQIHNPKDGMFEAIMNVPAGVTLKGVTREGQKITSYSQAGTQISIKVPTNQNLYGLVLNMDFDLDCSQVSTVQGAMTAQVFYYSDYACKSTRFMLADIKKDIYLHCNTCASTETTQFSVERKTLGWVMPTGENPYYTYGDLYGPSGKAIKVTRATPGIRLDAAYPKDEVATSIEGRVSTATNSLLAEIKYTSPLELDVFHYSSATFEINGSVYALGSGFAPEVTNAGGVYTHTYTIPLGNNGIPMQLAAKTLFKLNVIYTVDELSAIDRGEYAIGDLRSRFYSLSSGQPTGCLGYGGTFRILRPGVSQQTIKGYQYGKDNHVWVGGGDAIWTNLANPSYRDFPNEFRPLLYLRNNTLTLAKGFVFDQSQPVEFTTSHFATKGVPYTGARFSADGRSVTLTISDDMPVSETTLNFYTSAIIDCDNPSNKFEPVTTDYDTRPEVNAMTYVMYPYLPVAASHVPVTINQDIVLYNTRRPALQLTANSIQEGYGSTVEWPVQVCNPYENVYYATASPNTWVAVELKDTDQSTVLIGAKDDKGNDLEVTFYGRKDGENKAGRSMLIKLNTVDLTACLQMKITGRYVNCSEDSLQEIPVYAGWDYHRYPEVGAGTETVTKSLPSCEAGALSETMSVKYKTAALQWAITKRAPEAVDLCTGVPFDIDLTSTKYGDMRDLKVWAELPAQASFDQTVRPVYYYPANGPAHEIPADAYIQENGKLGWDIAKILGGNLPGIRLTANKIRLSFQLTTACGYDPGLPIIYRVTGYTNCGDYIDFADQRKIKLVGVSPDSLVVSVTGPSALACFSTNELGIHVRNAGISASSANVLELTLPFGTDYKELVSGDLGAPAISQINNQTVLRWTMPAGYLAVGQEKMLTVRTYLSQTPGGATNVMFRARTFQAADAHCSETNTACSTQVTSGLSEVTIPVTGLEALNIGYRKYTCAYQFIPSAQAAGNCAVARYNWSFGDGDISAEPSPFHAYATPGTYTVSLRVDFNCGGCSGSQSKQVTLNITGNEAMLKDTLFDVVTDIKKQVIQVSASTFADSWPTQQLVQSLADRNGYLNGTLGVWRNEGVYVYDTLRSASDVVDLKKDGTFSMSQFNWLQADIDAIPAWTKANEMTQYSPFSYELENRDVLGIYSAALYDYGGHLPSANGVNMRNAEMAFTSFEGLNSLEKVFQDTSISSSVSGNWIFGTKSLPEYYLYNVRISSGNTAIVEASVEQLKNVEMVDVAARDLHGIFQYLPRYTYITNDEIICMQPYPQHPEWTIVILKRAPFKWLWNGRIKVYNRVLPKVVPIVDDSYAHSGSSSLLIRTGGPHAFKQQLLHLDSGKNYMINAWVSVHEVSLKTPKLADSLGIDVIVRNEQGEITRKYAFTPSGNIIEGWQQVRGTFTYTGGRGSALELNFHIGSKGKAWYDDLRFHPELGNMKSYVYDLKDYRLRAILDEENFASYFYYDEEGNLYLTKKETEKGVKTISENVSSLMEKPNK